LRYAPVESLLRTAVYRICTERPGYPIRYPDPVKTPIETEIKLRVGNTDKTGVSKIRALLRQQGYAVIRPRVFEQNLVLDDEAGSLRERGLLLRVRGAGKLVTCTFKGAEKAGRHKSREEREFRAGDLDACVAVFAALGFREKFRYEKYRTEFARESEPGHVTLDETPIGLFMELEGPARWIDRTAKALGFAPAAYVTESYSKLYDAWCQAKGSEPKDMRFKSAR
jgi:adenylate cyclase class 2